MQNRVDLSIEEMPKQWFNIVPFLPEPLAPPIGDEALERLSKITIKECLRQETGNNLWVSIPEELQELYIKIGRPRPLFRAIGLEKFLNTKSEMYYKAEFLSPTGSHKINTAIAQAYYAKKEGFTRLVTETGAGQWGSALAYAASLLGLECAIYWVRAVHDWKKDRKTLMELYGAKVFASPSSNTEVGRNLLKENPNHHGSLGIAISEGMEDALSSNGKAAYCLGSVLNHVLLHQTVIGLETLKQLHKIDRWPDIMISCLGGGSNFGGFALPFIATCLNLKSGCDIKFIAAQSEAAPNLQGEYRYDYADHAGLTPQIKMYTLGHRKDMPPIKGDGLRYHGCSPIISQLRNNGYIDTVAYPVDEEFIKNMARLFIQKEGYIPAPESAYSIACAIQQALEHRTERKIIVFNISGHGFMDIEAYKRR